MRPHSSNQGGHSPRVYHDWGGEAITWLFRGQANAKHCDRRATEWENERMTGFSARGNELMPPRDP